MLVDYVGLLSTNDSYDSSRNGIPKCIQQATSHSSNFSATTTFIKYPTSIIATFSRECSFPPFRISPSVRRLVNYVVPPLSLLRKRT